MDSYGKQQGNITAIVNVLSVAKRASITEIANKANMPYAIAQVTK